MTIDLKKAVFLKDTSLRDGGTQVIYLTIGMDKYVLTMLGGFADKETDNYQKIRIHSGPNDGDIDEIVDIKSIEGISEFLIENKEKISSTIFSTWTSILGN